MQRLKGGQKEKYTMSLSYLSLVVRLFFADLKSICNFLLCTKPLFSSSVKIPWLILSGLMLIGSINSVVAQSVEKQALQAVLTLNFARFTGWPEEVFNRQNPVLNMCVIGDNIVQQAFSVLDNKIVDSKTLHIINISRLRNLSKCQLLYVSGLDRNVLVHLLSELKDQPILTVGENMKFIKVGGMVGLEKKNDKIFLNINLDNIIRSKLVVSSRILKLATIYSFPYLM